MPIPMWLTGLSQGCFLSWTRVLWTLVSRLLWPWIWISISTCILTVRTISVRGCHWLRSSLKQICVLRKKPMLIWQLWKKSSNTQVFLTSRWKKDRCGSMPTFPFAPTVKRSLVPRRSWRTWTLSQTCVKVLNTKCNAKRKSCVQVVSFVKKHAVMMKPARAQSLCVSKKEQRITVTSQNQTFHCLKSQMSGLRKCVRSYQNFQKTAVLAMWQSLVCLTMMPTNWQLRRLLLTSLKQP